MDNIILIGSLCGISVFLLFLVLLLWSKSKRIHYENEKEKAEWEKLNWDVSQLNSTKAELLKDIDELKNSSKSIYENEEKILKDKFDYFAETLGLNYQQLEEDYKNEYLSILNDYGTEIQKETEKYRQCHNDLNDIRSKIDSCIEVYKKMQLESSQKDFYRLELSEIDLQEIARLKEVEPYLRDPRPLNKVIWSVYYEHPFTDLVGRVVGSGIHTGIYKITNLINNMCYVGQAADFATRWKQHIKCAIGAENGASNKLYPAMIKDGVHNFTFEIIEECPRDQLNEREQYWQEVFKAKEFGYSIK